MHPHYGATPSLQGAEVCLKAHELITGDRNQTYSHPLDDYSKVAEIFYGITGVSLSVEEAVMFPLAMKLARVRTAREEGRWHEDSVVDAIGYLGCLSMIHQAKRIKGRTLRADTEGPLGGL